MNKKSRRKFSAEFKSKVCLEVLKERQSVELLAKKHDIHPTQINSWKREFIIHSATIFERDGSGDNGQDKEQLIQALYAQIGELKVANDFLKKKLL